jgi:hypothetical protein
MAIDLVSDRVHRTGWVCQGFVTENTLRCPLQASTLLEKLLQLGL